MDPIELLGWAGTAATVVAYSMKTMLPLRVLAVLAGLLFIVYSSWQGIWPMLAMELLLFPLNLWRLVQILRLRARVDRARRTAEPDFSLMKAYGRPLDLTPGDLLFARGDAPDKLYFIESGEIALEELGLTLGSGEILGELAFFTDAKARTATARCTAPARVFAADETVFMRLYFQDPAFGMAIMKTITRRLIDGMERHPTAYRTAGAAQTHSR